MGLSLMGAKRSIKMTGWFFEREDFYSRSRIRPVTRPWGFRIRSDTMFVSSR